MSDQSDNQTQDDQSPTTTPETEPSQEGQDGATETEQVDTGSTTENEAGE